MTIDPRRLQPGTPHPVRSHWVKGDPPANEDDDEWERVDGGRVGLWSCPDDEERVARFDDYDRRHPMTFERAVQFVYVNHRGERATRRVIPIRVEFTETEWHPECQWLLMAYDCDKQAIRQFPLIEVIWLDR